MAKSNKKIGEKILLGILIAAVVIAVAATIANYSVYRSLLKKGSEYNRVEIENQLAPEKDENGDKNIILTSGLKVMDMNVEKQLQAINDGTFKGGNFLLGADTDSTGYVSAEGRHQLTEETMAKLDEAFAKIKSGEIVPAANFNGYTPDAFPGL